MTGEFFSGSPWRGCPLASPTARRSTLLPGPRLTPRPPVALGVGPGTGDWWWWERRAVAIRTVWCVKASAFSKQSLSRKGSSDRKSVVEPILAPLNRMTLHHHELKGFLSCVSSLFANLSEVQKCLSFVCALQGIGAFRDVTKGQETSAIPPDGLGDNTTQQVPAFTF